MSDIVIRHVEPDDFTAVTDLLADLGRPKPTPRTIGAMLETFQRHVAKVGVESVVAERDGVVVGFCSLHFRERLNYATPEAWVPDLIVIEREQGQGAAVALFNRAVEIARKRGCHRITLESAHHRERAHRFYEREGMKDAGKYFILDLI